MPEKKKKPSAEKNSKAKKALELTDQQAADVRGGGRNVIDCEGYAYLSSSLNSPNVTKPK